MNDLIMKEPAASFPRSHENDLISRQAAIKALGDEPEVWSGNDEYAQGLNNQWNYDVNAIKAVPSAESKIIRCKDCKHRDVENVFCEGRGWPMQLVPDDGFCDKGERREE